MRQITSLGLDGEPSVSPDGTKIAFTRTSADHSSSAMWLMAADGSGAHLVTAELQAPFAWSPDSRRVAAYRSDTTIGIIAASGGPVQSVPNTEPTGNGVSWSPDGQSLAFRSGTGPKGGPSIKVVRTDGTGLRALDTDTAATYPNWSPDGRQVAYSETDGSNRTHIWVVAADGTSPGHEIVTDRPDCNEDLPAWMADSRQLVVSAGCPGAGQPDEFSGTWILRAADGHLVRLTTGGGYQSVSGSGPFTPER